AKQVQQRRQCGGDARVQRIVRELVERHPGQLDALGVVDDGLESAQGLRDHRRIGPSVEVEDMSVEDLDARSVLVRHPGFLPGLADRGVDGRLTHISSATGESPGPALDRPQRPMLHEHPALGVEEHESGGPAEAPMLLPVGSVRPPITGAPRRPTVRQSRRLRGLRVPLRGTVLDAARGIIRRARIPFRGVVRGAVRRIGRNAARGTVRVPLRSIVRSLAAGLGGAAGGATPAPVEGAAGAGRRGGSAAPPPPRTTRSVPLSAAASRVLVTSTSTTASSNPAAISATRSSVPSVSALVTSRSAAVLRPEKEKLYRRSGSRRSCFFASPRGNFTAVRSPGTPVPSSRPRAAFEMFGPPG